MRSGTIESAAKPEGNGPSNLGTIPDPAAYLAAIVNSADDAIVSKNLSGVIQTWNPGAERIFGYPAEEAIGKSILLIIPPDRTDEEEMILARIRKGERIEHFLTERMRKDGRRVTVSVTISPIKTESGEVIGASKIARDVSDDLAAQAVSARLAAIIESSDDAIVSKDLNGVVESWNKGAERIFGYMAEEMVGQPITRILPKDRLDEEDRILTRLRNGERVDHFETVRTHKSGKLVDVSVSVSPIRDGQGRIVGASKVARDISDRKNLEATLTRMRDDLESRVRERTAALEEANREMEAFTYSLAHDLRGPLRAIGSTSAILERDYADDLPDDARELLERQILASKRLASLIDDLLQYSRLGRNALNCTEVNLSEIAHIIAADLGQTIPNCRFDIQEGMRVVADKALMTILLQNLMDNGCKFSDANPNIEVGEKNGTYFVSDHGQGFDMTYAEKIFQPFERLVNNDEVPGSGIGLANVRRIVEKHGGKVWVRSAPGQGTTFFFTLKSPSSR